jgi:predicted N-acyltransferase
MQFSNTDPDYVIRVYSDPSDIDPVAWDGLLAVQAHPVPFMRSAYLRALHDSGSALAATGWQPQFISLWRDRGAHQELAAASALYLKAHSYGEYVFDWAWADAYQRHGLNYYPKLLSAVPFTPVPGARLIARDASARQVLASAMVNQARSEGLSSLHVLFLDETDAQALEHAGCMIRQGVQFHWTQDPSQPITDFTELLQRLHRDKRKKIQQEQRRVKEAGVHFTVHEGSAITEALWDFFYACYCQTYREHRSTPYLTREFFARMQADMPENWVLFVGHQGSSPVASSLIAVDPQTHQAFGRYWGARAHIPCLHFDACYYQPLAWCLSRGYTRFEGGAQGEHKMARGLLPVATRSAHWIADERFAHAVDDFLKREGAHMGAYLDELREHNPFKS